jgi:antitoxin MazE
MKANVVQWGNSLGIRVPKAFAELLGIERGDAVEMKIEKDKMVLQKKTCTLDDLVKSINTENLHSEMDWGAPVGKELW